MADRNPQTFHHGNLREALLQASLVLLDEAGPEAVTIRAAARAVGVSHAAPFNHFKDRKALLTGLAINLFEELHAAIEEAADRSKGSPKDTVRAFPLALIDYGLQYPNRFRLLWRRDLLDNDDAHLERAMDQIYEKLTAEIARLPEPGTFDHDTVAIALWSLAQGYASMRINGTFEAKSDTLSGKERQDAILELIIGPFGK